MGQADFAVGACVGAAMGLAASCVAYRYFVCKECRPLALPDAPLPALSVDVNAEPEPEKPAEAEHKTHISEFGAPEIRKARAATGWDLALKMIVKWVDKRHPGGLDVGLQPVEGVRLHSVYLLRIPHLSAYAKGMGIPNRMGLSGLKDVKEQEYNKLMGETDAIIHDIVRKPGSDGITTAFLRAGPRAKLHFDPSKVRGAIVTCGGLCPGLNNIIQGVTRTLLGLYGAEAVLGVRGGYAGFSDPKLAPMELTLDEVEGIQLQGGTIIGSGRGSFDAKQILEFLRQHRISHLYVCGGDGTHRAANKLVDEAKKQRVNIAVCGVPKTIDNDIDLLDRSFGFNTAVAEAQDAIRCAMVEAQCNKPNGIGIVKLMGRHSGFIAVHSTLCSGEVDLCLVPEVPVVTEGPKGCLPHLQRVLEKKGYALIVVAEGAGEEILGQNAEVDKGGNRKLPELGLWLKDEITRFFKSKDTEVTVKYIDPSYTIRSVAANAADAIYCELLAQNAVHGAMAGYTAFSVGMVNNRLTYIPIDALVNKSPRKMDCMGRTWERVLSVTGQPNTVVKPNAGEASSAVCPRTVL